MNNNRDLVGKVIESVTSEAFAGHAGHGEWRSWIRHQIRFTDGTSSTFTEDDMCDQFLDVEPLMRCGQCDEAATSDGDHIFDHKADHEASDLTPAGAATLILDWDFRPAHTPANLDPA